MSLTLITAPSVEPLTTAEAKLHLRVDSTADDTPIGALIVAARQHCEAVTRRQICTATWDWKMESFPIAPFDVPLPPLQSVTHIKYTDTAGTEQTWAASNYIVDAPDGDAPTFGRVGLAYGISYPSVRAIINTVQIRFVAGYGAAADVPQGIKQAMYLIVGHLYENREEIVVTGRGEIIGALPMGVDALLWPYRAFRW